MHKREISYKDFNDTPRVDIHYFNITRAELMEMMVEPAEGLDKWLEQILADKDKKNLLAMFKKIILSSYGEKSEDGKSFLKSDELSHKFSQTAAYDAMFTELTTDDNAAAIFIKSIVPEDLAKQAGASEEEKARLQVASADAVAASRLNP